MSYDNIFPYVIIFWTYFLNIFNTPLLGLSWKTKIYRPEDLRGGAFSIHRFLLVCLTNAQKVFLSTFSNQNQGLNVFVSHFFSKLLCIHFKIESKIKNHEKVPFYHIHSRLIKGSWKKKFVGQRLGVTHKSWLTPKSWLLIYNFDIFDCFSQ